MISKGVQELIDQLHTQGVEAGKQEAENIIQAAENKAQKILNDARIQSEILLKEAMVKIEHEKKSAIEALALAARNMRLEVRESLIQRFKSEVQRLIHKEMVHEEMLSQFILMIAANTAEEIKAFKAKNIEIQLPAILLDLEKARQNPDLLKNDALKPLIQSLTKKMIGEGITFVVDEDKPLVGIKARLVNEQIEMDLSEEAVGALLLKHMEPRFYALLEGIL